MTVKTDSLAAVPSALVIVIAPLVAPAGTVAVTWTPESTVKVAEAPLNETTVAPVRSLPAMVTSVPTGPEFGEKEAITGIRNTAKSKALVRR